MSKIYRAFLANEASIKRIFARYFRQEVDIEDFTQETFARCFAAEMKTEIRDPKSFLLRSAKNLAFSERKKKMRTTTIHIEDSGGAEVFIDESNISADASLDGRRKLAAFLRAIALLPPDCRRAFVMRKVEKLQLAQIANRLGVSVSTVQNRVARALVLCDEYLRRQGYGPKEFGRSDAAAGEPIHAPRRQILPIAAVQVSQGREYEK